MGKEEKKLWASIGRRKKAHSNGVSRGDGIKGCWPNRPTRTLSVPLALSLLFPILPFLCPRASYFLLFLAQCIPINHALPSTTESVEMDKEKERKWVKLLILAFLLFWHKKSNYTDFPMIQYYYPTLCDLFVLNLNYTV